MHRALVFSAVGVMLAAAALPVIATTQTGPLIVSVTTSPNPYAIKGTTSVTKSVGILGYGTGTTDVALEGYATKAGSVGLEGFSQATSGAIGDGVFGYSANGAGLFGVGAASSAYGVYASNAAAGGTALAATSSGASGKGAGVDGSSVSGDGVVGTSSATDPTVAGVEGDNSSSGIGVLAESTSGIALAASSSGSDAVFATLTGTCDECAGVAGVDMSPDGRDNYGVSGFSSYGVGLLGSVANAEGTALDVETFNGATPISVYSNGQDSTTSLLQLDPAGNLFIDGSLTQAGNARQALRDARGVQRVTYAPAATQATVEDFGRGRMSAGSAHVSLDPAFASLLAASDYLVFVTPRGPNAGTYVTNQSLDGFDVRDSSGRSSFAFDYRIVGTPRTTRAEPRLAELVPERTAADVRHAERFARLGASGNPMARALAASRDRIRVARQPKAVKAFPMPFVYQPPAVR